MNADLLYQLALTQVPNIGLVHAKILAENFGTAEQIFKAKKSTLEKIEGIGEVRAGSIKLFYFTGAMPISKRQKSFLLSAQEAAQTTER